MKNSKIEWTDHTFSPWVGCQKVSAACDNCYAEAWAKRSGMVQWGPHAERRRTTPSYWGQPIKWNKDAMRDGIRRRVFCASLADVFDNQVPLEWRGDLWALISRCSNLDFLLLTKRPQNIRKMLPFDWDDGYPNVWLGLTAENQEEYDRRWPSLARTPARVRFISYEPALGPLSIRSLGGLLPRPDWVIAGGESGPKHRPPNTAWFRAIRDECAEFDVPYLFKQFGGRTPKAGGRLLDGVEHNGYPA